MFEFNLVPEVGTLPVTVAHAPITNPIFPALGQDAGDGAPPPPPQK